MTRFDSVARVTLLIWNQRIFSLLSQSLLKTRAAP